MDQVEEGGRKLEETQETDAAVLCEVQSAVGKWGPETEDRALTFRTQGLGRAH